MPTTTRTSIVRGRLRRALFLRRPHSKPDDPLGLFGDGPPSVDHQQGQARATPIVQRRARRRGSATRQHSSCAGTRTTSALLAGNPTTTSLAASALADKLDSLCSATVSVSQRRVPIMHAGAAAMVRRGHHARPAAACSGTRTIDRRCLSLVPEFGRIPVGSLNAFDIDRFLDSDPRGAQGLRDRALQAGPRRQPESNVRASRAPGSGNCNMWGFFHEPKRRWREQLKALLNPNGGVTRPVKVKKPTRWKPLPRTA